MSNRVRKRAKVIPNSKIRAKRKLLTDKEKRKIINEFKNEVKENKKLMFG